MKKKNKIKKTNYSQLITNIGNILTLARGQVARQINQLEEIEHTIKSVKRTKESKND